MFSSFVLVPVLYFSHRTVSSLKLKQRQSRSSLRETVAFVVMVVIECYVPDCTYTADTGNCRPLPSQMYPQHIQQPESQNSSGPWSKSESQWKGRTFSRDAEGYSGQAQGSTTPRRPTSYSSTPELNLADSFLKASPKDNLPRAPPMNVC